VIPNIENTAKYYREILGFRVIEHYNHKEKIAAFYRDAVEILLIGSQFGTVKPNKEIYGAGYDAYFIPESTTAVDAFYHEIKEKGAKIVQVPSIATYGSREFAFEDIDGRLIGVGMRLN
jgi:uncharacterized glyoxalase superfamily protein PhnB